MKGRGRGGGEERGGTVGLSSPYPGLGPPKKHARNMCSSEKIYSRSAVDMFLKGIVYWDGHC
jgi:hypothetical protein